MNRPDWDTYFMTLCFLVSRRSLDKSTQHGTVAVASDNTILSTGYNSPPRGFKDHNFPQERPKKYNYVCHSEVAAIANAARSGICLKGSTFYITGFPCPNCFNAMVNAGVSKIVYGPVGSNCVTDETRETVFELNDGPNLEIGKFDALEVEDLLEDTLGYYHLKVNESTKSNGEVK